MQKKHRRCGHYSLTEHPRAGAGIILVNPDGAEFTFALKFDFQSTNNESKYEALLAGLRIATKMKIKHIKVRVDLQL